MSNRFGKEMIEAAEEMAAHIRGEIEVESYEIKLGPDEQQSGAVAGSSRKSAPSERLKKGTNS